MREADGGAMSELAHGIAGVAKALARIAERDPLALVVPSLRKYWADIDTWELRFQSATGKPRDEVWELIKQLPTNRDDNNPDLEILRAAYIAVREGVTLESMAATKGVPRHE
jgi:hypothetical protein